MTPFAIWFTGLPGCGKSALAETVREGLARRNVEAEVLRMDDRRKVYFPNPRYTATEREQAYRLFADEAAEMVMRGKNVLMDGTALRRAWRDRARTIIPRFAEFEVLCSLDTAMAREKVRPEGEVMAGLYEKALKRKDTGQDFPDLGEVPGVDVPYEENPQAEIRLDNDGLTEDQAKQKALSLVLDWLGLK